MIQRVLNKVRQILGFVPRIGSGVGRGLRFDRGDALRSCVTGEYEKPVQDVLCSQLRSGDTVYDVGGNVGFFSVLCARLVGSAGAVYTFEPVPVNASRIERNASMNGFSHVHVLSLAVSDEIAQRELLLASHVGGSALASAGAPPDIIGTMFAETITLDAFVQRESVRPPDLVKIDVEGAELQVLHGMRGILETKQPRLILEFDDETREGCERKVAACRSFLEDYNYHFELLPNWYAGQEWFVRHLLATPAKKHAA